jgi:hypothetical protein
MTVFKQIYAFFGQLVVATGYARTAAVGDAPRDAVADAQFGPTAAKRDDASDRFVAQNTRRSLWAMSREGVKIRSADCCQRNFGQNLTGLQRRRQGYVAGT